MPFFYYIFPNWIIKKIITKFLKVRCIKNVYWKNYFVNFSNQFFSIKNATCRFFILNYFENVPINNL